VPVGTRVASYTGWQAYAMTARVSEVSDIIVFLQSSPLITGEILHVDGGQIADH
jgi:NAD(P)-dependent dehydrogenase (short-subunit alcohol dehydrogenase family)